MAATLTTTPGAPSTSLQRLHHVEKVVSRTSLSLSGFLFFCHCQKFLGQKKAYKHVSLWGHSTFVIPERGKKKTSCWRLLFWSSHALRDIIVWFYFYSFQKLKKIVGSCFFGSRRIIEITEVQSVAMLGFHKFCCHVLEFTNSVYSDKKKG
jgi:hypothetical protein